MESYHKIKTVNKNWRTASSIFKIKEQIELNIMMSEFLELKEGTVNLKYIQEI